MRDTSHQRSAGVHRLVLTRLFRQFGLFRQFRPSRASLFTSASVLDTPHGCSSLRRELTQLCSQHNGSSVYWRERQFTQVSRSLARRPRTGVWENMPLTARTRNHYESSEMKFDFGSTGSECTTITNDNWIAAAGVNTVGEAWKMVSPPGESSRGSPTGSFLLQFVWKIGQNGH